MLNLLPFRNRYFTPLALLAALLAPSGNAVNQHVGLPGTQEVVLPDTEGAISEITFHYDPLLHEQLDLVYEDLLHALSPDVRVRVLCPSDEAAQKFVNAWGQSGPAREIQVINVGIDISAWARDRCIARHAPSNGDRAPSFVPASWDGYWDYQAGEIIAYWVLREA